MRRPTLPTLEDAKRAEALAIAAAKARGDWHGVELHTVNWHILNRRTEGRHQVAGLTRRLAKKRAAELAGVPLAERMSTGKENFSPSHLSPPTTGRD